MPIDKLIISMSLPIMISMLVQALYNIVDSIFVAQISENALTAVSMAFPIQNLMIAVGVGTAVGVNALAAHRREGFHSSQQDCGKRCFSGIAQLSAVPYHRSVFRGTFFRSQTDIEEIVLYGKQYLTVCCCLSFGCFTQLMFERMLQATGKTVYTMITQTTGAVASISRSILIFLVCLVFSMASGATRSSSGQMIAAILMSSLTRPNSRDSAELKGFHRTLHHGSGRHPSACLHCRRRSVRSDCGMDHHSDQFSPPQQRRGVRRFTLSQASCFSCLRSFSTTVHPQTTNPFASTAPAAASAWSRPYATRSPMPSASWRSDF